MGIQLKLFLAFVFFLEFSVLGAPAGAPVIRVDGKVAGGPWVAREFPASITMSTTFSGGSIYYTLDGTTPSSASTKYLDPFAIFSTKTIRAIAYTSNGAQSALADPLEVRIVPFYTLTLANPAGTIGLSPLPESGGRYPQGATVQLTAVGLAGWSFMFWEQDLSGAENPKNIFIDGPKSVRAVFGSPITIISSERGTIHTAPAFASGTVIRNYTDVKATPVPAPGFYFREWTGRLAGAAPTAQLFYHTQPNAVLGGIFDPLPAGTATFTATADHGGEVAVFDHMRNGAPKSYYDVGSLVFAHARPANGFAFAGWSGDFSGMENPITMKLDASKVVHASFLRGGSLTVVKTDGGNVSRSPNENVYTLGTVVTLNAAPLPGFTFVEWSGAINSRDNPVSVTVTSNLTVNARFAAQPWNADWSRPVSLAPLLAGTTNKVLAGSLRAFDPLGGILWEEDPGAGYGYYPQNMAIDPDGEAHILFYAENPVTNEDFSGLISYSVGGEWTDAMNFGSDLVARDLSIGHDGALFVGLDLATESWGSILRAIGPNGTLRWEYRVNVSVTTSPVFEELRRPAIRLDGTAIMTGFQANYRLYAQSAQGQSVFARQLEFGNRGGARGPGVIDYKGANVSVNAEVVLGSGGGYVIEGDGSLMSFDNNGNTVWRFKTLDVLNVPSIGADGALYLGSVNSGNVYAVNADGTLRWRSRPGLGGYGAPAIGADGKVYIADAYGLYALGAADGVKTKEFRGASRLRDPIIAGSNLYTSGLTRLYALDVGGAANSPWPMRNANPEQSSAVRNVSPPLGMTLRLTGGGEMVLVVRGQPGASVRIFSGEDLARMQFDLEVVLSDSGEFVTPLFAGAQTRFFTARQ